MSTYNVISAVGETLRQLLLNEMKSDSAVFGNAGILKSEDQITLNHPYKLIGDGDPQANALSMFLYRIVEDADEKNRRPYPAGPTTYQYPPLPLHLFYLVTPITNSADNNHKLMGKVLEIMFDHAVLRGSDLQGDLKGSQEELRLILNPISLEDITKLWSAIMRPYQLSVSYEVKVVRIDSNRTTQKQPVYEKQSEFQQI
ncbi:MAG TPA: DUF4255 domain-containing protein [Candidatus Kapabacteria bacterium]|nr:DUF4255 domain-containing protein [Candidatus Kapabacteria bacterium]